MKNNACVTVNIDFWSRVRWFVNDFHEWRSHEWKSLANHFTSDQKIAIHGNECIVLFLTRYFISRTHNSAINYQRWLISPLSLGKCLFWLSIVTSSQLICDVTRTRVTSIVTSYSSIVLARANLCKDYLHWWKITVYIELSPGVIHVLAS